MAFHPIIDLLKRNFGIEEGDSEEVMVEKIKSRVLRLGEALRPMLPYLRYLLAVDSGDPTVQTMDPKRRRGETFHALQQLMLRAAEVRPQVLIIEDLQWVDQTTETFLVSMADSIPTGRIFCLFTYRPGYVHPFGDRTYHTRIVLPTLSTPDTVQMAQDMLATEHLPLELQTLIVQKAEGNPFFVEEIIKSLREGGDIQPDGNRYVLAKPLEEIVVPDTIQDVLMTRIDRLQEAPKRSLQVASVIGREFTYRLLEHLADEREQTEAYLEELKVIELIYEKHRFPELSYLFKHALTQDVAYHSLLEQRRQELHRLIGLAIEALYADGLAEQYEILAYHFTCSQTWDKALAYLLQAAEKATKAFANREAITLYDQALEVTDHLGDTINTQTLMQLHQAKAKLYFILSDFENCRKEWERFLTHAQQLQDRVSEKVSKKPHAWQSVVPSGESWRCKASTRCFA
ncbi:hypothetical protein C2W62_32540 [Candidatus Entotheonella serta]|nr:hypothetical protein C2W62_32540 [Candidatus Entotheonella serta]